MPVASAIVSTAVSGFESIEQQRVDRQQQRHQDVGEQPHALRARELARQMRAVHDVGEDQMAADDAADRAGNAHQHEDPERDRLAEPFLDLPRVRRRDRVEHNRDDLMRAPPCAAAAGGCRRRSPDDRTPAADRTAELNRSFTGLRRQRSITSDNHCGTCAWLDSGSGVLSSTRASVASADPAWNGWRPEIHSYISTPNANTSAAGPAVRPSICSGDMYAGVPAMPPGSGAVSVAAMPPGPASTRARPKSSILMRPSRVRITFSGLRSRCVMPLACALASADASSRAVATIVSSDGRLPVGDLLAQRVPLDELRGDVELAVELLQRVHRADARMRQHRGGRASRRRRSR